MGALTARRGRARLAEAAALVATVAQQPWGQVSASIYETARLVALAPWLDGHAERVRFLIRGQRADGGWGMTGGYGLVPTLSATDAVLAELDRSARRGLRAAALRGLAALRRDLAAATSTALPDTPAIEIIVPALVESINRRLSAAEDGPAPHGGGALPLPAGSDPQPIAMIRVALAAGQQLPPKVLHSLEVAAPLPSAARAIKPVPQWTVGASPAATAAWLGERPRRAPAARYLREVARHDGGPVPSVIPITAFERAWVLSTLADTGLSVRGPDGTRLVRHLATNLDEHGTAGGEGLPPDADTTSVALLALQQRGRRPDLDCLFGYEGDSHFRTWPGERTASVSTNAHVLDALALRLQHVPGQANRYRAARDRVARWLTEQQDRDGAWSDKWHASPYYATASCVTALARGGEVAASPPVQSSVNRAVTWTLASQRDDGGWGRWASTAEETAYAVRILWPRRHSSRRGAIEAALDRARSFLLSSDADHDSALWHDKDLYRPRAVVAAAVLGALHLLDTVPGTTTLR